MHFHILVCIWTGITKHARIDFNVTERFSITSEKKRFKFIKDMNTNSFRGVTHD